ncbi:MAG: patatin-like phospholipase family protein [Haloarculaceae archaeon]
MADRPARTNGRAADTRAAADGDGDGGRPTRVAIACQGGGSHTAFTAGVLRGLLSAWPENYELVGISGTSGGAFNALATWYGLVTGEESTAVDLLDALWADLAAEDPADQLLNDWLVAGARWRNMGLPSASLSPYANPAARDGQEQIAETLESRIDFDSIPDLCSRDAPELVVGTVDVNGGVFETFTNEDVTAEAVLASAALPELFPAVEIHGHDHWDGLFSQNPPVMDLMTVDADRKPDELWVVQINPQERAETPKSLVDIADRRNELAGNISLNQELRFIEWVNEWVQKGYLPAERFSLTTVRRIELGAGYDHSTKLDRTPSFIEGLIGTGEDRAAEFLARLANPEREATRVGPVAVDHDD